MNIKGGQWVDVSKEFPEVKKEDCVLISENGIDTKTHFDGMFYVKINRRGLYCFENGRLRVK